MAFPGQAALRGPTHAHRGAAWLEHAVPAPASHAKIGEIGGTVTGVSLPTLHDGEKPIQLRQSGSAVEHASTAPDWTYGNSVPRTHRFHAGRTLRRAIAAEPGASLAA